VENVQKECKKESKNLSFKGFGYPVTACSFWKMAFEVIVAFCLQSKT
jgi:hypothetical protein